MNIDPNTTKYMVKAKITADGIIEKPDVVGAIFGQTEGLLGDELDLRDLQKSGRIGRIEVEVVSKGGKSEGIIYMSSSLDQVETVILASALETVDRVGPCKAGIRVLGIEDVRVTKREKVVERAKELLNELIKQSKGSSYDLMDSVRQSVQIEEITSYGKDRCPAGPDVKNSDTPIIIVEGRSDVLNLLKAGIKNAIAVEGTNIPKTVQDLSRERVATAFVDGDRGGELILRELFQVAEVDFIARAPRAHEVEELTSKQIIKCLRNKIPGDQYMEMNGLITEEGALEEELEEPEYESEYRERKERDRRDKYEDRDDERRDRRDKRDESRRDRKDRRDKYEDRDDERRDRRDRKDRRDKYEDRDEEEDHRKPRFDDSAIDKYKKKKDESESLSMIEGPEAPAMIGAAEEKILIEAAETPDMIAEPAKEIDDSKEPVSEEKKPAEKPKTRRTLRGKKSSDKVLTPEQTEFRDMLLDLSTTHNAKILGEGNALIREVAVKNLVNSLKEDSGGAIAIVFDGVISQRILDISAEKGIYTVIGTRKGNISKMPAEITILTKEDLY
ncbi:MAG: DNA primase [Candidatus Methanomethylophilaceae archaeon]|nr:DNA primase [Candidatus Methanomethylophilaceae archaeon]